MPPKDKTPETNITDSEIIEFYKDLMSEDKNRFKNNTPDKYETIEEKTQRSKQELQNKLKELKKIILL
ncbi:hypothetical protein OAP56_01000 [Rickettsiaceae bacterium]|nr:hypothetical protein [Rickettsiaceae bacterium]